MFEVNRNDAGTYRLETSGNAWQLFSRMAGCQSANDRLTIAANKALADITVAARRFDQRDDLHLLGKLDEATAALRLAVDEAVASHWRPESSALADLGASDTEPRVQMTHAIRRLLDAFDIDIDIWL